MEVYKKEVLSVSHGDWASFFHHNTGLLNCMIQGGRTYNEQQKSYQKNNIFDLDLQSCYGTALQEMTYPIGLPTILAFTSQDKKMTLKDFFSLYEKELVENLYTITINGFLTFEQTLLYSKLIEWTQLKKKIQRALADENEDEFNTDADFVILKKELQNTIITSHLLETLRNVCNVRELKEIYSCEVQTACFYKKSDYIEDKDLWVDTIERSLEDKEFQYTFNIEKQCNEDKRCRKWTGIPCQDFFRPLIQRRNQIKTEFKKDPKNILLAAEQEVLKLIINCVFGVFASPFFRIGNSVLANNITAKARNEIWMYSRALGGIQCITDGFAYQPSNVFQIRNDKIRTRRPSLETLSNLELMEKHKYVKRTNLGGVEWEKVFEQRSPREFEKYDVDDLATKHMTEFLSMYNLGVNYKIEHKREHISDNMFYTKKSHYVLQTVNDSLVYKIRGTDIEENPTYLQIAKNVLGQTENPISLSTKSKRINTVSDYKRTKNQFEKDGKTRVLIPGQSREIEQEFHFTTLDLPYKTAREYLARKKTYRDYNLDVQKDGFHLTHQLRLNQYETDHSNY